MAGLCWMVVVLAFSLSAGNSLAAVDQNWLASIIEGIKNEYALGETFSLAVNVPKNQDPNSLQQVLQDDPADKVTQTVSEGQVYQGTKVVAAAQSGAVSRVLQNIQALMKSSQGNFLIIYSEESPCSPTCTNEDGITANIKNVLQNWRGYAFVFSKVDAPGTDTSQRAESFKQLGISQLGLDNIFRCYQPGDDPFQCTSCSSGGDVTPSCVANDVPSNQEQGVGEESTPPPTGTGMGGNIGNEIDTDIGEQMSKCKGRGSRKRGCKGGKVKKGRKQKGVGRRRKGGKVKKGRKQKGVGRRRKGGKTNRGRKQKGRGRRRKGGKTKRGRKQKGRGRRGRGGKAKRGRKRKSGRRG